jgi:DNA-directed RNA polymerase subunit RPC12/RpoP
VKKTIVAAAVPQDWDAEALYAKAQRYIERMQDEPSDDWEHALWSSFALELLARAALSNVSPALLADTSERNWQHLFHSLGFTPTEQKFSPRSIAIGEVLKRLKDILPEFDNELEAFCIVHTGRRNAELHSGTTPFDGVEAASGWHAKFYRSCIVLLKSMGYELADFVGEDEEAVAVKLIAAVKDETAKSTRGDVSAHQKVWLAKSDEDRKTLSVSASAWAIKQTGHRVKCPACGSDALLKGEPVAAPHKTIKEDEITEAQEYLPSQFECIACGLKISGLSRLNAIDLGARYKKTLVYDAGEYYAPEEDYSSHYEEDNNE